MAELPHLSLYIQSFSAMCVIRHMPLSTSLSNHMAALLFLVLCPLAFSFAILPTEDKNSTATLLRRTYIPLSTTVTCSSFYGSPSHSDCTEVEYQILDVLGTTPAAVHEWGENSYEFIAIGGHKQYQEDGEFYTPLYWNHGR